MCDTLCDSQKVYSRVKLRIPTLKNHPHGVKCFENSKRPLNPQFLLLLFEIVSCVLPVIVSCPLRSLQHGCMLMRMVSVQNLILVNQM